MFFGDRQRIGIALTGFGLLFLFLGVLFFFDRGLIAMGNLMFAAGVATTIGPAATLRFFTRRKNWKGTGFLGGGMALVLWGWALLGMPLELYGFWLLFAGFIPNVLTVLRRVPVLGTVLDLPPLKRVLNLIAPPQSLPY